MVQERIGISVILCHPISVFEVNIAYNAAIQCQPDKKDRKKSKIVRYGKSISWALTAYSTKMSLFRLFSLLVHLWPAKYHFRLDFPAKDCYIMRRPDKGEQSCRRWHRQISGPDLWHGFDVNEGKRMDRLHSYGWIFLLIAMAGDLLVSLFLSLFYSEYNSLKMSISALGNPSSPVRVPFNIWMLLEGVLFLLALPAVYKHFHSISGWITDVLILFIAVFAVGACIFTCFFSVNESRDVVTVASKIHGAGSVAGFMLFLFVPLLMAILYFKDHNRAMGIVSITSFVMAIVFFSLFVMSDKPVFKNTAVDHEGLWQRLSLVFMYLPLAVASLAEWGIRRL